jgi:transcriptional regulator with XRE-family HTH domain
MKKIPGVPAGREYTVEEFETANERVRAARETLLREPLANEAHQRLGDEIALRVEGKRAKLAEVRRAVGLTQQQLAETLGMDQGEISRLEHRENVHLTTLSRFIEATGGELRVVARYGTTEIELAIGDIAPSEEPVTALTTRPKTNVRSSWGVQSDWSRKGGGGMTTNVKEASKAGRILANPKSSKAAKSVAASDLAQSKGKGRGK